MKYSRATSVLGRAARSAYRSGVNALPTAAQRRWLYLRHHGRPLRLRHPRLFTEKLNWRMAYDRRDVIAMTTDKLQAKQYAEDRGVRTARTLWIGTDVRDFERGWSAGDQQSWVLKPNFSSGHVVFGEGRPDVSGLTDLAKSWLAEPTRASMGEWSYAHADRVLLAEERLGSPGAQLLDYKFFVFQGEVALCRLTDLTSRPKRIRWYDVDWAPTDYVDGGNALLPVIERPASLGKMLEAARLLGEPFDFIRVDLFDVAGGVVFGELTPYPAGGLEALDPRLEKILGDAWRLPALQDS